MSGFLFLIVIDWIMRRTVCKGKNGIRWRLTTKLDDLDFADDIALLSSSRNQMQEKTSRMDREAKRVGLKINLDKTKVIRINAKNQVPISIVGKNIKEVEEFTYLGGKVNKEGGGMEDLQNRLSKQMPPEDSLHTLARSHHHQRVTSQSGNVTSESGSKEKKMKAHWPHSKAGQSERYKDGVKLETGGKKKEGRPKTTWRRTVEREMKEGGWGSWEEV
ncbi:uncharacterized protein [Montipora foliosa]|uniref:uncharacterized protein n=1 Tax=Montipora foliosa TaxID=591990 RepID=UPI0035F104C4